MKALLLVSALLLAGCAHNRGVVIDAPAQAESIDADMRAKIAIFERADMAVFIADCVREKKWKFLSCYYSLAHFSTFPGLTKAEVQRYIDSGTVAHETFCYYGIVDETFLGGSRDLCHKLAEVREAYAASVNRAVLTEIKKADRPNQSSHPTPL
jgi:hypothetical protein